ncbi:MAG TPA: hypothetical protein VLA75_12905 [Thermoanaerobaculia bacterium]|nr:hypothetical protein [Thermoanaerobaculia bacterium]
MRKARPVVSGKVSGPSVTHDQPSAIGRSKVARRSVVAGSTSRAPLAGSKRTTRGGPEGCEPRSSAIGAGAAAAGVPRVEKVQRNGVAATPAGSRK